MTALIRSELLGLRSLRSTWLVPLTLLGLVGLITGASMVDLGKPGLNSPAELREPLVAPAGIMSAIAIALLAAVRVGGEYRYETITQRFLVGNRGRVVSAKVITYAVIGVLAAVSAIGLGLAIAGPAISGKSLTLDYDAAGLVVLFVSVALGAALFGALGVGIAFITRSQTAALLVLIGLFPIEKIAGLLLGDSAAYMPYGLLQSLIDQGGTASPTMGAVLLGLTTASVVVVAWRMTVKRDVT